MFTMKVATGRLNNAGGRLPPDECPIGRCNRRRPLIPLPADEEWEIVDPESCVGGNHNGDVPEVAAGPPEPVAADGPPEPAAAAGPPVPPVHTCTL